MILIANLTIYFGFQVIAFRCSSVDFDEIIRYSDWLFSIYNFLFQLKTIPSSKDVIFSLLIQNSLPAICKLFISVFLFIIYFRQFLNLSLSITDHY